MVSDGITDAAKQTREALEYVRRKAEKEMIEQQKKRTVEEIAKSCARDNGTCSVDDEPCLGKNCAHAIRQFEAQQNRPLPVPTLYKTQTDDDGAVGKVAICLCDQCKVNGFLCLKSPRAISPCTAPLAKENLTVGMVTAYEAGLAEGARKACEDFAKDLNDMLMTVKSDRAARCVESRKAGFACGVSRSIDITTVQKMIESLRSTTPQSEQE